MPPKRSSRSFPKLSRNQKMLAAGLTTGAGGYGIYKARQKGLFTKAKDFLMSPFKSKQQSLAQRRRTRRRRSRLRSTRRRSRKTRSRRRYRR